MLDSINLTKSVTATISRNPFGYAHDGHKGLQLILINIG